MNTPGPLLNLCRSVSRGTRLFLFLTLSMMGAASGARAFEAIPVPVEGASPNVVSFGTVPAVLEYHTADAYVSLRYSDELPRTTLRFRRWPRSVYQMYAYTSNFAWKGAPDAFRNGLLDESKLKRVPLFWRATPDDPGAPLPFSANTASFWTQAPDRFDPDFVDSRKRSAVPVFPNGQTFVSLGARNALNSGSGNYDTQLVFELSQLEPDAERPVLFHSILNAVNDLLRRIFVLVRVQEDVDVVDAVLSYRVNNGPVKTIPFLIEDDADSPFVFNLKGEIPVSDLAQGNLSYWFSVKDSAGESTFGGSSAPAVVSLVPAVEQELSSEGGRILYADGSPLDGIVSLQVPAGALQGRSLFRLAKTAASDLSEPMRARFPEGSWPVLRVSSDLTSSRLTRTALLTLVYDDTDQDGRVDGTEFPEADMRLYWWDGYEWRAQGGRVDLSLNEVTAPVTTLGVFSLFPSSFAGTATLRPREKVITPGTQDGRNDVAYFDGAAGESVIRIFDVSGRRIREIRNLGYWDGRDESGAVVETGVYVFQVESQGEKASGTIAVAR